MKSTIRKIWDAATAVLVCLVVAFAGLLVGPKLFGLDVYIVLSELWFESITLFAESMI